jgi:hypothetical protein
MRRREGLIKKPAIIIQGLLTDAFAFINHLQRSHYFFLKFELTITEGRLEFNTNPSNAPTTAWRHSWRNWVPRSDFQRSIDKIANKLPGWKTALINPAGRTLLSSQYSLPTQSIIS